MKRVFILISAALPLMLVLGPVFPVFADISVEVSGNGDDSSNSVDVSGSSDTSSDQSNDATVSNDVDQNANSGSNTQNGNSGDVSGTTGGNSVSTTVNNDLNHSTVNNCCPDNELNITVSGNGANSVNTIHTEVSTTTTINILQNANVQNNLGINANTGNNYANGNGGSVTMTTGNITGHGNLQNSANITTLTVGQGAWDITIIARDNGQDSTNVIFLDYVSDLLLWKNQQADITNNIYADLNTGGNVALGNLNDTLLTTGDVDFSFETFNGPINTNTDIICCDDGTPVTPPPTGGDNPGTQPPGTTPPSNPGPSNGHGNGGSSVGQVLGALTDILPATGASALHFWILAVVYLLTFLSGLYVRLRAGRSPTLAIVRRVGRPATFRGYRLLSY